MPQNGTLQRLYLQQRSTIDAAALPAALAAQLPPSRSLDRATVFDCTPPEAWNQKRSLDRATVKEGVGQRARRGAPQHLSLIAAVGIDVVACHFEACMHKGGYLY